jgi:hypothetical protein
VRVGITVMDMVLLVWNTNPVVCFEGITMKDERVLSDSVNTEACLNDD